MQKYIDELKNSMKSKVECQAFDEELDKLKDLINQLASSGSEIKAPIIQSGPNISSKDLNDIREALKKVAEHEVKLNNLDLDKILKKISQIAEEVVKKADKSMVETEFKRVQTELDELRAFCKKLEDMTKQLASSGKQGQTPAI